MHDGDIVHSTRENKSDVVLQSDNIVQSDSSPYDSNSDWDSIGALYIDL